MIEDKPPHSQTPNPNVGDWVWNRNCLQFPAGIEYASPNGSDWFQCTTVVEDISRNFCEDVRCQLLVRCKSPRVDGLDRDFNFITHSFQLNTKWCVSCLFQARHHRPSWVSVHLQQPWFPIICHSMEKWIDIQHFNAPGNYGRAQSITGRKYQIGRASCRERV